MSYIVTKEWVVKYTTRIDSKTSAINSPQAKILGFEDWNMIIKGWREKIIGIEISNARKELFERLRGIKGKINQTLVINSFKEELKYKKEIS